MKRGFTLVELIVVITVIGILAAVVIVNMSGGTDKANITKGQAFSAKIGEELAGSLVSEWRFDEGTGLTANDAWGANGGILNNFNWDDSSGWRFGGNCVSGSCLEFDGNNDYVDCGNDTSFDFGTGDFSVEAWFKTADISQSIVAKQSASGGDYLGFNFYVYGGGTVSFIIGRTGDIMVLETTNTWNDDKWHHSVAVRVGNDATNYRIYIDGVNDLISSDTITDGDITNTDVLKIGSRGNNDVFFNGLIDEVRIYNNAADLAQVQSHYLAGLNGLLSNGAISKLEYNQRIKNLNKEMVTQ